ncbi:hypothetical protein BKA62DRAFT_683965 [Auriculariales sp. MPI-PUGE-AT-0066]|nr:hypothetical protein BKA62DRAFT_683965 [Auriculariales sp. MPI-PUGE-AT-0066]
MAGRLTPPTTESTPTLAPSVYSTALQSLVELAKRNDPIAFVAAAEDIELRGPALDPTRLLIAVPLVLAYLVRDDVPPARFALTRLPPALQSEPLASHTFNLVASTAERKYPNVYARAVVLREFCEAKVDNPAFVQLISVLLDAFIDGFRKRAFDLVSKSYSSIPLNLAQFYLGLPEDRLVAETGKVGWTYANGLLTPSKLQGAISAQNFGGNPSTVKTFEQMIDVVAQLEGGA